MKINKIELFRALEIVKPGLSNREIIEQATSFAFARGQVATYNDEISISHPVKGLEIEGAIRADELFQLLDRLTAEEIELEILKNNAQTTGELLIKAGKSKAGLAIQQEIKLPLLSIDNPYEGWIKPPPEFIDAIKFVSFCCSKDMSKPVLTTINIRNDGWVESCDNFRAVRYTIPKTIIPAFLLSNTSAQILIRYKIKQIRPSQGWVHFRTEEGTIISCRVFEGTYPDLSPIFTLEKDVVEIKFPRTIKEILERAKIFSKREFALDERVNISVANNQITIYGKGDYGWFEEHTNIQYKGEPVGFVMNPSLLQDSIGKLRHCVLTKTRIKFEGENWEHVVALHCGEEKESDVPF